MHAENIDDRQKFHQIINAEFQNRHGSESIILLESQQEGHPANQQSYLASRPKVEFFSFGDNITYRIGGVEKNFQDNPWNALKKIRQDHPGWFFGYLGYDLKNYTETLQSENLDLTGAPDVYFFQPEMIVKFDHSTRSLIDLAGRSSWTDSKNVEYKYQLGAVRYTSSQDDYLSRIRHIQKMIKDGNFYEINLSHVLQMPFEGDPFGLYLDMKKRGPVPFGAFMSTDWFSVCCSSPERFLCRRGEQVFSQPIKGTAPKHADPGTDQEFRKNLLESKKDRAENLMIVDLVRHDLSRVAKPGTVRVPNLFELQSFETVHQLLSTVEGMVDPETDPVTILTSCFPMGSMTGAPKIQSMKVIEDLEDYKRGIYSGAIGYITPDGDFDFNVVIRSAIISDHRLIYPVGGAITSDSVPEDEWEETLVKARALPVVL